MKGGGGGTEGGRCHDLTFFFFHYCSGSYCPAGTAEPYPCPPGTFGATDGLHNESSCTQCLAGSYCESYGLLDVEGDCSAGYYCPTGSDSRTEVICTTGDFCPTGSDIPVLCPEGTFNPYERLENSSQCTPCTEGSYCDTQGMHFFYFISILSPVRLGNT